MMESWDSQTSSPNLKFEHSPAESFLSTPSDIFPSLFDAAPTASSTMDPLEMMTPESYDEEQSPTDGTSAEASLGADGEKKPVKKRKSWGQVLPEPKTNLPPRKRAKTEDEKEQRRVERVLRNRRAAQSSRERKRLEVEALEHRNKELESQLMHFQQVNVRLLEELNKFQRDSGIARSSPSFDALRPSPVTFSQQLFTSQDSRAAQRSRASSAASSTSTTAALNHLLMVPQSNTINPASISPSLSPVAEDELETDGPATTASGVAGVPLTLTTSPDMTQHPAAMLCEDLQCQSAEVPRSLGSSQQPLHPALALFLQLQFLLASTSAMISICQRPLVQIAMSSKAGFSLLPTPAILNTIIWLVTTPSPFRTLTSSTSTNTSTTPRPEPTASSSRNSSRTRHPSSTLRLKVLRKILTCSPNLARPLMDATMAALRLVSSKVLDVGRVPGVDDDGATAAAQAWLRGADAPSREVLLTLMWALRVEEHRIQIREGTSAQQQQPSASVKGTGRHSTSKTIPPAIHKSGHLLKGVPKRDREEEDMSQHLDGVASPLKRSRFE